MTENSFLTLEEYVKEMIDRGYGVYYSNHRNIAHFSADMKGRIPESLMPFLFSAVIFEKGKVVVEILQYTSESGLGYSTLGPRVPSTWLDDRFVKFD